MLQMHKEWLERRAQLKALNLSDRPTTTSTNSSEKSATYFRRIIKFRTENQPISSNDISFMPKKEFDPEWMLNQKSKNYHYDLVDVAWSSVADKDQDIDKLATTTVSSQEDSLGSLPAAKSKDNFDSRDAYQINDELQTSSNNDKPNESAEQRKGSEITTVTTTTELPTTTGTTLTTIAPADEDNRIVSTTPIEIDSLSSANSVESTTEIMTTLSPKLPSSLWNDRNRKLGLTRLNTRERSRNATKNWGPWSEWSNCSRECGGGVRSQIRECLRTR